MLKTSIVIPCFNEALRISPGKFKNLATESKAHLVFVDDGSTDGTGDILKNIVRDIGQSADLIEIGKNSGKGEAVRKGLLEVIELGMEKVGYIDADMATPVSDVCHLVDCLDDGQTDVALGSRVALLGHRIDRSPWRHYLGRVFATAASLTLDLPVYDTQCGAKFFRVTDNLKTALATPFVSRWAFDVELIGRLNILAGASRIREIPLREWYHQRGSTLSGVTMITTVLELIKIRHCLQKFDRQ